MPGGTRRPTAFRLRRGLAVLALLGGALSAAAVRAEAPTFLAEVDRNQVAAGEVFLYEVTISTSGERVDSYHAPEFKGLQVVNAPQGPNQSTQMQMGGGGTFIQNSLSWRYQLTPAAGQKGLVAIGPARIRVDGREMRSNVINIRVGAGQAPPPGAPAGAAAPPAAAAPQSSAEPPPPAEANGNNFIRAVPDKTKAFVGEQITVGWYLYFTESQNKYETITEPRTDGFWTEDVTPPGARNRTPQTQQLIGGRVYQVATLFKRALFPLQPGKLTISPIESEIAQLDFFGMAVRKQRLKAEPVLIEALPLPRAGQPSGFDTSQVAVGRFTLNARADRNTVAVGEAVTLTIDIQGHGNLRNLRAPALPRLDGWKSYEPKVTLALEPGDIVSGTKTVEYLLLPDRPGTTMLPSFELAFFDPDSKAYAAAKSDPIRLEVTSDGTGHVAAGASPGGSAGRPATGAGPVENVIATEIRPIRTRTTLNRDLGATFYRSRPFLGVLLLPPLALALGRLAARVRERWTADSQRSRRRRVRQLVRRRLGAAEDHRDAGRWSAFHIEIDRVLRDVLAARLRRPVSGLRMDELRDLLLARGMPAEETARVIAALEGCDLARFAPAADDASGAREQMNTTLDRAGELIVAIDKAHLREEPAA